MHFGLYLELKKNLKKMIEKRSLKITDRIYNLI